MPATTETVPPPTGDPAHWEAVLQAVDRLELSPWERQVTLVDLRAQAHRAPQMMTPEFLETTVACATLESFVPGYEQYPELTRERLQLLWVTGEWDGITTGLCRVDEEPCWFDWCAESHLIRHHLVYRLTPAEFVAEETREQERRQWMGVYREIGPDGWTEQKLAVPILGTDLLRYRAKYPLKPRPAYAGNPVVGWFAR